MSFSESISNAAKAAGKFVVNACGTAKFYTNVVYNKVASAHQFIAESKALNPVVQVVSYVAGPALTILADDGISRFFSDSKTKQLVSRVTVVIGFSLTALAIGSLAASWPLSIGLTALAFVVGSVAWNILSRYILSDDSKGNEKPGEKALAELVALKAQAQKELDALIDPATKAAKDVKDAEAVIKLNAKIAVLEKQAKEIATNYDIKSDEEKKNADEAKKKEETTANLIAANKYLNDTYKKNEEFQKKTVDEQKAITDKDPKFAEYTKLVEEAKTKSIEEEAKKAAEAKKLEEANKQAEAAKLEATKLEETKKLEEANKLAETKKQEEAANKLKQDIEAAKIIVADFDKLTDDAKKLILDINHIEAARKLLEDNKPV